MSIRYSGRALADLRMIADYVAERRTSGAASVMRRISATAILIARCPGVGPKVRARHGLYAIPIGKYPYRIYYRIEDSTPIIIHIRHGARRLPKADELV